MYRAICLGVWAAFFFFLLPPTANAFWDGRNQDNFNHAEPSGLVVKYKPGVQVNQGYDQKGTILTSNSELNAINSKYGLKKQVHALSAKTPVYDDNPLKDVYVLYPENKADLTTMASDYNNLECVEYAHPNYMLEMYEMPNDSLFSHQWALNNTGQGYYHVLRREGGYNDSLIIAYGTPDSDIDALETMENPPDNAQIAIVAIVDTGIDWDHPDLSSHVWTNMGEIPDNGIDDDHNGYIDDVHGWNFAIIDGSKDNNLPLDDHGHGTHCAGIVNAVANNEIGVAGVVPDAKIMAVKIFYDFSVLNACRGIIYAADNGADVISMSWGMSWPVPVLEESLEYARAHGVLLVAASGNDGDNRTNYPSGYPIVITVTATDSDDHVTYFSTHNSAIDVCAPGQSILSLRASGTDMYAGHFEPNVHIINEKYYLATGTSMAAPHAAAVAAYMRAISPGLSPDMTQSLLQSSAKDFIDPLGDGSSLPGWDEYSGYGRVNLPAALAITPDTRARIDSPTRFSVVSGPVEITGSADGFDFSSYVLEYGAGNMPSAWTEITNSAISVSNGSLGALQTDGLEGLYTVRLRVNASNIAFTHFLITSQALAEIQSPVNGQTVEGEVTISGSALCSNFDHSEVEYGIGSSPASWYEIASVTSPIYGGELAIWNTVSLDTGTYTLRLSVYSNTGLEQQSTIAVKIGSAFSAPDGWIVDAGAALAPIVNYADVNQDGVNEILAGTKTGMRILSNDGTILTSGIPYFPVDDYRIPPAVGRLDNDNFDDIVAVGASGKLYIFPSAGNPIQVTLTEAPDNMDNFITADENRIPKIYLKDINGDGIDEIHYTPGTASGTRSGYYFIYHADGSPWGCGIPPSNMYRHCYPADLNGDGIDEIYCYGNGLAEFDTCGQFVRSVPVQWEGLDIDDFQMDMSAVDIDNDGETELIIHGYFHNGPSEVFNYQVFAYKAGLQLIDGWPHDLGFSGRLLAPGHPVFGDLDGDGSLDYVMAHNDQELGYLHAWHIDGVPLLGNESPGGLFMASANAACFSVPLILDCNADGIADISVSSGAGLLSIPMIERIMAFGLDTKYVDGYPLVVNTQHASAEMHAPVYGDINQDGFLDVVYPSDNHKVAFANFPGITYDPEQSFCPIWRYNRSLNATLKRAQSYSCGDSNGDGHVNVSDAVYLINYVFIGGAPPNPLSIGNANCDGSVNVSDAVYIINYIFVGGNGPCDPSGDGVPDC